MEAIFSRRQDEFSSGKLVPTSSPPHLLLFFLILSFLEEII
jgi:hypothetical protein